MNEEINNVLITDQMKKIKPEYIYFDGYDELLAIKDAKIYILDFIQNDVFTNKHIDILIEKTKIDNKLFWIEVVKKIRLEENVHKFIGSSFKKKC